MHSCQLCYGVFLKSKNLNVACKKLYVSELFDFSHFFKGKNFEFVFIWKKLIVPQGFSFYGQTWTKMK